jgi:hypothetical protein
MTARQRILGSVSTNVDIDKLHTSPTNVQQQVIRRQLQTIIKAIRQNFAIGFTPTTMHLPYFWPH